MKGYVQVYTGNGKGKTTAAIGLAVRAAGAGRHVFIGQFVKGMFYSEFTLLKRMEDLITLKQYGRDCFITDSPTDQDKDLARRGLEEMRTIVMSGKYDLVIFDEATIAVFFKLFTSAELRQVIIQRAEHVEVVITGRYADKTICDLADLITEMSEVKHYYTTGVEARTGIEK